MPDTVRSDGGETLWARLDREGQLPLADAVAIAGDIAAALGPLHRRGVARGDLEPRVIRLEGGRARLLEPRQSGPAGRAAVAYLSPEQAGGSGPFAPRADVYALGCILYEMLGGEPPYTGRTAEIVLAKQRAAPVPHLRALREGVPESVERAVTRALAREPADRFATAEDFVAALAATALVAFLLRRPDPAPAADAGADTGSTPTRTSNRCGAIPPFDALTGPKD